MRTQLRCSIRHTVLVLSTLAFTLMALSSGAFALTFTTIDVPGGTDTEARGINSAGQIVGSYIGTGGFHGFLLDKGIFTTIDADLSDAMQTLAGGINAAGQIVGGYLDSSFEEHGFVAR
jgi:uncharacterized membrane protein